VKPGVYLVRLPDGRIDHVRGKRAAIARANEMADIGYDAYEIELRRWHGVIIKRVSEKTATAVGLA
jgi:hypothetical protein